MKTIVPAGWGAFLSLVLAGCFLFSGDSVFPGDTICPRLSGLSLREGDSVFASGLSVDFAFSEPVLPPSGMEENYSYFFQVFPVRDSVDSAGRHRYLDVRDSIVIPWRRVRPVSAGETLQVALSDPADTARPDLLEAGRAYRLYFGGFPRKTSSLRNQKRVFLQDTAGHPVISRDGDETSLVDTVRGVYPEDIFMIAGEQDTSWVLPLDTAILFFTK